MTSRIIGIKRKPCEVSQIPNGTSLNSDIMFNSRVSSQKLGATDTALCSPSFKSYKNGKKHSHQALDTKKNVPLLKASVSGITLNKLCPDDTHNKI